MKRFYLSDTSTTPPSPPASPAYGYPQNGNRSQNRMPTAIGAYWFHMITEEFMAVIEDNGVTPSETNLHQLRDVFRTFRNTAAQAAADARRAADAAGEVVAAGLSIVDGKLCVTYEPEE